METKGRPAPRLAPGARVTIRDEDWIIRRLDLCDDGGHALTCDGLSELVRGTSTIFLERLKDDLQTHDPARTELFQDHSDYFTEPLSSASARSTIRCGCCCALMSPPRG